jgi:uncharacterized peroxidase-related enzyme
VKRLFPSLPDAPGLADVMRRFPRTMRPLLEYHDALLRAESDLPVADRELVAAYVSGLNACAFCFEAHRIYARAFGIDPATVDALLHDPDTAPVPGRLKPLLAYVRKLTLSPARMTEADAAAVYAAGWSEEALFDAVQTCALFNLMNRIVEGTGVAAYPETAETVGEDGLALRRRRSYVDFGRAIGVID